LYLDLENPALYRGRWWQLLQSVVREFSEVLKLKRSDRSKVRALNIIYSENDAAAHFKADIEKLRTHFPENRMMLAFDQIEHITFDISPCESWSGDFLPFWETVRSVHQDSQGNFCFVFAGVNPYILETDRIGKFDNPLFSTTRPYYLPPFGVPTVREMVRRLSRYMGLNCQEELYQRLAEEYGGHPYLIRQACSYLAKTVTDRPGVLTTSLFEKEREHLALALEKNVRQILNILAIWYPNEYELMRDLAMGDRKSFTEFASLSAEFTQHMDGYGLVRDPRGSPKITIGLVRAYLTKYANKPLEIESSEKDIESVLAEISQRRNAIERRLRHILQTGLRFQYGKKATEETLGCLPKERKAVLVQFSYEEMWAHLYFNELAFVVEKQWAAFQNWFEEDKGKVVQWLDHVNRSRVDAHARTLSDDDLSYLRVCFRRLEEKLHNK
jgi:hypothetical protein